MLPYPIPITVSSACSLVPSPLRERGVNTEGPPWPSALGKGESRIRLSRSCEGETGFPLEKQMKHILLEKKDGLTLVTLNRPELHNAFNETMIGELANLFGELSSDPETRVILLNGAGKSFCAGADLNWMKEMASYTQEENLADAKRLHDMLESIDQCAKPVVAHVHGAALGGGTGLISVCDMVFAHEDSKFGFTEVKLGLIPAVISPFVIRKIGEANAREFFLTGERFSAPVAREMGLIQGVGTPDEIQAVLKEKIKQLKGSAPGAQAAAKELIRGVLAADPKKVGEYTSGQIAERRASAEGKEGMSSFLEKRKPSWLK